MSLMQERGVPKHTIEVSFCEPVHLAAGPWPFTLSACQLQTFGSIAFESEIH